MRTAHRASPRAAALALGLLALAPRLAAAGDNDLRLMQLNCKGLVPTTGDSGTQAAVTGYAQLSIPECVQKGGGQQPGESNDLAAQVRGRNAYFRELAKQMALVLGPRVLTPSETLGLAGFETTYALSVVDIPQTAPQWRSTEDNLRASGGADNVLFVHHLETRKGLPFSLEAGGHIDYLQGSRMFMVGGDLKWAYNEGYEYVPDFSFRVGGARLLNSNDLRLSTMNLDFGISKWFNAGGVGTLTPYTGYQMVLVNATSGVIDPTPQDLSDESNDFTFGAVGWNDARVNRWFLGLRFVSFVFTVTAEAMLSDAKTQVYSLKVGFDY